MHHVGPERLLPALGRIADRQRADVADQRVDAAQLAGARRRSTRSSAAPSATSSARPKALHALGLQRGDRRLDLVGVARADRDVGAFGGEGVGDGPADALAAAGDDGPLALQSEIHVSSPVWEDRILTISDRVSHLGWLRLPRRVPRLSQVRRQNPVPVKPTTANPDDGKPAATKEILGRPLLAGCLTSPGQAGRRPREQCRRRCSSWRSALFCSLLSVALESI